ncbi:FUSC family protein [Streptomyces sp. NPDC051907]|uniref:FUSC family protein n=1 Tax=Streptomyces sp. NPDC051907 TaxID=3155284 RepID=UPI00341E490C
MTDKAERTEIVHRAVRVTAAACLGFYPFVYAVDETVIALYALFAPVALGVMSPIPGSGRQRAAVMLRALPVGLLLVALGTVLAVRTWSAVLGMLVVGFLLTFAAVAGPRAAGTAPGLQLFYILACFPPYAPDDLGARLAGLTLGVLLLAAFEVVLLPARPAPSYRERLAHAVAVAGRAAAGEDCSAERLRATGRRLRLSRTPPAERPAGARRSTRALAQAGGAARRLLDQLARLSENEGEGGTARDDPVSAALLSRIAAACETTAAALRTGRPPPPQPQAATLTTAINEFQALRRAQATGPPEDVPPRSVLRRRAAVLAIAGSARTLETSAGIGLDGRRTPPIEPRELFWYAESSTPVLWWRRFAGHATPGSVLFQNAVRIALGLGAARLVAGSLDLAHGFWVLLAVLTLGRTTAVGTWTAVRSALVGTLVGAVTAGLLLFAVGGNTDVYAVLLAPGLLAAFSLGPLLGIAWSQALFTLAVATAFAQIAPATWQLAEQRIVDVVTGSVIGLLCGLIAWPAGARKEVRRTMAALLRSCVPLVDGTVEALVAAPGGAARPPSTMTALHRLRLAEAAYFQLSSEPGRPFEAPKDWHGVLITANHVLVGALWLARFDRPASIEVGPEAAAWARDTAEALDVRLDRVAALCAGDAPARPAAQDEGPAAFPAGPPAPVLVDLELWLTSLTSQLARLEHSTRRRT